MANEQTAYVYWEDWQVPSICLRPNVVYGVARDQGISAKNTIGIQAAVHGEAYTVPFTGDYSRLYAGEAAAAFIAAISSEGKGAHVFDMNGPCKTIEEGLSILNDLEPGHNVTASRPPFPFPSDLDESPLRKHVADYPEISVSEGISATHKAFKRLKSEGRLPALPE